MKFRVEKPPLIDARIEKHVKQTDTGEFAEGTGLLQFRPVALPSSVFVVNELK